MANILSRMIKFIRKAKWRMLSGGKRIIPLNYGMIYDCNYMNYHKDPHPLIFCLYSGQHLTHSININYLNFYDKNFLLTLIVKIKKSKQIINGRSLYYLIKKTRKSIIDSAYRTYYSSQLQAKLVSLAMSHAVINFYSSNDPFVKKLNSLIMPSGLQSADTVKYEEDDLIKRATEIRSRTPLKKATVRGTRSATSNQIVQNGNISKE